MIFKMEGYLISHAGFTLAERERDAHCHRIYVEILYHDGQAQTCMLFLLSIFFSRQTKCYVSGKRGKALYVDG